MKFKSSCYIRVLGWGILGASAWAQPLAFADQIPIPPAKTACATDSTLPRKIFTKASAELTLLIKLTGDLQERKDLGDKATLEKKIIDLKLAEAKALIELNSATETATAKKKVWDDCKIEEGKKQTSLATAIANAKTDVMKDAKVIAQIALIEKLSKDLEDPNTGLKKQKMDAEQAVISAKADEAKKQSDYDNIIKQYCDLAKTNSAFTALCNQVKANNVASLNAANAAKKKREEAEALVKKLNDQIVKKQSEILTEHGDLDALKEKTEKALVKTASDAVTAQGAQCKKDEAAYWAANKVKEKEDGEYKKAKAAREAAEELLKGFDPNLAKKRADALANFTKYKQEAADCKADLATAKSSATALDSALAALKTQIDQLVATQKEKAALRKGVDAVVKAAAANDALLQQVSLMNPPQY